MSNRQFLSLSVAYQILSNSPPENRAFYDLFMDILKRMMASMASTKHVNENKKNLVLKTDVSLNKGFL